MAQVTPPAFSILPDNDRSREAGRPLPDDRPHQPDLSGPRGIRSQPVRAFEIQQHAFDQRWPQQLLHLGGVKCSMSADDIAWHNRKHGLADGRPVSAHRAPKQD